MLPGLPPGPSSPRPEPVDPRHDDSLPLFVYGTLLDAQLLANLLEHYVSGETATLDDFELLQLPGLPYPVIYPTPRSDDDAADAGEARRGVEDRGVEGRLYRDLSVEDYRRLDAYEGVGEQLYERVAVTVRVRDETLASNVYVPSAHTVERYQTARRPLG